MRRLGCVFIQLFLLHALVAFDGATGRAADRRPAPAASQTADGKDSHNRVSPPPTVNVPTEGEFASRAQSPSVVKMLEGYEQELLMAATIAVSFFVIGWICGGNYYLRRERRWRNKIRL